MPHRRRRCIALAAVIACAGLAATARAAPPVVVPPRLDPAPEVAYPKGAEGDANVVLILSIAKDGAVESAEIEAGADPFAAAAKEAAATWRFEPATRDGKPMAARIRFAVTFHGPVIEPPPTPLLPPPAAREKPPVAKPPGAPRAPPKAQEPIEVLVVGEKLPPAAVSLSRAEVRQLPGTFGDPFRAIEVLPGVTPIVSGLPFFYVRGAPPGNIGYFLDGVRVPYLFHVAAGPSIVNPAMVERVDLHPGGYPARYGRFTGAIVAAETTAPRDDWHGEGNLRVVDAGAMVEGGFAGGKGTVLAGGRYSYTAALFSLISPDVHLDYRDFQFRVTYDITPRDRVSVFAFGAYDLLTQTTNGVEQIVFGSEFYRVDLRYDRKVGAQGNLRWAATGGFDQTRVGEQRNARDVPFGTRVVLTQPVSPSITARMGLDLQFDHYSADKARFADPDDPDTKRFNALFPPRADSAFTAWGDVVWKIGRRLEVTPGVRFDMYRSAGASKGAADARLAVRADITDRVRLLHAIGVAHQPPSFLVPLPGVAVGSLRSGLQTSYQASAGVEVDLPGQTTAAVTLFDDVFLDMSDTLGVRTGGDPATAEARSLGSARGLEVYVRRRLTSRLGGFLAYTLSRSTRKLGRESFPSAFDRTHVFNLALAVDIGRGFRAGGRLTVYTGAPVLPSATALAAASRSGTISLPRDPAFYRIDLRAEKRWDLGKSRWISVVLEMLNTTLHKEIINGREVGPVSIPSLGVEGGF